VPSTLLEAAYESGDPRKARTILYSGGSSVYNEPVPAGLPNPSYNHKVLSSPSYRARYLNNFGYWMNVRILRYADVVLMYAEAANELNNTSLALTSLNKVRARARGTATGILPDVTTTDKVALRAAIYKERQVELALENDRLFDVIRQGRGAEVFGVKGFKANKNEVWPIPQTEIDLSGGLLTQNPGY
jgi:hypothetical protein